MSPLDDVNIIEQHLCDLADLAHDPIGGTFELSPLCNMDCKMCYVRMSKQELEQCGRGRLLTLDEWTEIGQSAVDAGLLVLLLTGGEPLMYPDFMELYRRLHDMGLVISINTNGILMTEAIAAEFGKCPPRRINITLYGASDETYARLCGNPKGFTQVMHAVELMKKYNIPFKMNCSVTPYNVKDLPKIYEFVKQHQVKLDVAPYMFPPARKQDKRVVESARLTPEQAAAVYVKDCLRVEGVENFAKRMATCHDYCTKEMENPTEHENTIPCRAGSSTWWVNWQGIMTICGMFEEPAVSVVDRDFRECWNLLRSKSQGLRIAQKCADCPKKKFCIACAASALAETGRTDEVPDYLCRMTDAFIEQVRELAQNDANDTIK